MDGEKNGHGPQKLDSVEQKVLGHMVKELRQRQGVAGNAGHKAAHSVGVVKREGQLLTVAEHLGAHIPLDFGPQIVSLIVVKVGAPGPKPHQRGQACPYPQHLCGPGGAAG